uniref:Uncharacterized protein n=1 Tax=Oryza meridionalis TaxID=40149 RepID=A0A0E0D2H8_9ORYZ
MAHSLTTLPCALLWLLRGEKRRRGKERGQRWLNARGQGVNLKNLVSKEYYGHRKKVHFVAWSCIGTELASGSTDRTNSRVWRIYPHLCLP